MVDLIRQFRPQIAERIVRERGEMQHGIKSNEVRHLYVSDVFPDRRHFVNGTARQKRAPRIEITVQSGHLMTGAGQHWRQNSSDVAKMTGYKNAHCFSPRDLYSRAECRPDVCASAKHLPVSMSYRSTLFGRA